MLTHDNEILQKLKNNKNEYNVLYCNSIKN